MSKTASEISLEKFIVLVDARDQAIKERDEARDAARWMAWSAHSYHAAEAKKKWPWLRETKPEPSEEG